MRIIARRTLLAYVEARKRSSDHKALKSAVDAWYAEATRAPWRSMQDIKDQFGSASIIDSERVVFNIKGNDYRLIVAFDFERVTGFVKWIGTHAEYDKIDAAKVSYGSSR